MENNILDATARVTRELTVSEPDNVHGGYASSEHGSAGDAFLKIDGIRGEKQEGGYKDEIHVSSFSFGKA
jgi:hypothetical protein